MASLVDLQKSTPAKLTCDPVSHRPHVSSTARTSLPSVAGCLQSPQNLCLQRSRLLISACSTGILRIRIHALISAKPRLHCEYGGTGLAIRARRSVHL